MLAIWGTTLLTRTGVCRLTDVPTPLCSLSGAHTVTSPTWLRASARTQRPRA